MTSVTLLPLRDIFARSTMLSDRRRGTQNRTQRIFGKFRRNRRVTLHLALCTVNIENEEQIGDK